MLRLFADTDCDITPKEAEQYGFTLISMPYVEDGNLIRPYVDWNEFDAHAFYDRLRGGQLPSTCALSPADYVSYFEPVFAAGDDILYVHFSSGMSSTFNAMRLALDELKEKYPERKFYDIDTLLISIGGYAMATEIGKLYKKGATGEEIVAWAEKEREHFAVYFFAEDLKFFGRSGRVSGLTATMGNLIGIKPIINMNSNGVMDSVDKARGTKNCISKVLDYVERLGENMKDYPVYIASADCDALAERLKQAFVERFGEGHEIHLVTVNPTIGSHCGPDCTGVCFRAKTRE